MDTSSFKELLSPKVKEAKKKIYKAFVVFSMATLILNMSLVGVFFNTQEVEAHGSSGSIWTTTGSCGTPQDENHYCAGDEVFINGSGFGVNTDYSWFIKGQNGSADKDVVVASSTIKSDGKGGFCFSAYTVKSDDDGEYKADVNGKNDNYQVNKKKCSQGTIIIKKELDELELIQQQFNFTGDLNSFNLKVPSLFSSSKTFEDKDAGIYNVTESIKSDWYLKDINCTGDSDQGTTYDLANRKVSIDLDGGETITCTFTNKKAPVCGDGKKEDGETCEKRDTQSCIDASGYSGSQLCNDQCNGWQNCISTEKCGDGKKNGNEECDGSTTLPHTICTDDCKLQSLTYCGDGTIQSPNGENINEICEINNTQSCEANGYDGTQTCNSNCLDWSSCVTTQSCGDEKKNGNEQCDGTDGVFDIHHRCTKNCTLEYIPYCGDGNKDDGEECDDNNIVDGDGCSANCTIEPITVTAYKVVCNSETDLPDWGNKGVTSITPGVITAFMAGHSNSCHFESDWYFQWSDSTVDVNPGDNLDIVDSSDWTTVGPTGDDGSVTFTVDKKSINTREALKDGYIEFTGPDTSQEDGSAEFYCYNDVLNYDNWEWMRSLQAGSHYYCVAFNAPTNRCGDSVVRDNEECDNGEGNNDCPASCSKNCELNQCTPPEPFCGDGVVNQTSEQCDNGKSNGSPTNNCTSDCTWNTEPYCAEGEVEVIKDDLDYLNIGDVESEGGRGLTGWSNAWVNGGWGGNYGGGSDDKSFRLLMGPGDGCAENNTSASFTLDAGTDYANQLTLNHLDGSQSDSFDIYVNGNKVGHYSHVAHDGEMWVTSTFNFPPATGTINVELKVTEPATQWCADWGQVGFSWAKINGYTCYQARCSEDSADWKTLDNADLGNNTSEAYHPITGWSAANIPGNYGGCQNGATCTYRQVIENPCTSDQKPATVILHAGTNTVSNLKVRHLDGISLADSFEIWVGDQKIAEWQDATEETTENWTDTTFDVSQYNLSGDITLTFVATDNIWSQCNAYGQVSIDWVQINGCGTAWEPKIECGNGVVENGEECDAGAQNGQSNSTCTIQCKKTDPYCEQGRVTINEKYLDSVNIGDAASEAGHNISVGTEGTGWSNAWVSPGWGGTYGGGSSNNSFRLLMGPGDGCGEGYKEASFTLDTGANYANQITLEHLDGSVNDSFDIYFNNSKIGHYEADASTNENWGSSTFYFSPFIGLITVKLVANNPDVSWCGEWGQVAFSNAGIKGYTCQGTEIIPRCGDGTKNQSSEQCDGADGVTTDWLCNAQCQLYQETKGGGSPTIIGGGTPPFLLGSTAHGFSASTPPQVIVKGAEGAPSLKITKAITSTLSFASPGQKDIEYTVTVTNEGNLTAYGVNLKDILPAGFKFADGSVSPRTWDLGDIEAGKSKAVTYKVNVEANAKTMLYKNTAEVTATNIDKPVQASVDLDVRAVNVLAATGFNVFEFIALTLALLSSAGLSIFLRRKITTNEN